MEAPHEDHELESPSLEADTCDPPLSHEVELESLRMKFAASQAALEKARHQIQLLKKRLVRMEKKEAKQAEAELALRRKLETKDLDALSSKLPPVPAAIFKILLRCVKKVNWFKEKAAMELCLSLHFRSPAAYRVLRASGFVLPHPSTLRRRYQSVLRKPGFCPVLLGMLKLRAMTLMTHEKQVTLAFDGMTVTQGNIIE